MAETEVELGRLQRKYADLRIAGPVDSLVASMAEVGQQAPVLVVGDAQNGSEPVLIDGYRRVRALGRLKCDTVRALHLDMDEAAALVLRHQQAVAARPTALEDGWLLAELLQQHGANQRELAQRLQRSPAWVSGRLGLVRELPDSIQDRVQSGQVPAHAAARNLLAFARANKASCEQLCGNFGHRPWTTREIAAVCRHWHRGTAKQRDELQAHPELFVKALDALAPRVSGDPVASALVRGLGQLSRQARRLHGLVRKLAAEGRNFSHLPMVSAGRRSAAQAWQELDRELTQQEVGNA